MARERAFVAGTTRRALFALSSTAAVAKGLLKMSPLQRRADALAKEMERLHGNRWIAHLDHDAGFILIRPSIRR